MTQHNMVYVPKQEVAKRGEGLVWMKDRMQEF